MKKITLCLALVSFFCITNIEAQITSFPYLEDFESGDGGWVADNTNNGTWALGAPTGAIINVAASGTNAWVTNLSGNYNSNENSSVTSPVFDFSSLGAPSIQLSIWYDIEFSWDGAVLQSSIDSGNSWQNVGQFGDPNNWYTDNTINGNPGGQQEGWSGTGTAGTNTWVTARSTLTGLAGETNVIFRIAFGSDGSITDEGFGFDDINIFDVTCPEPSGMVSSGVTATTANLDWTAGNTETSWNIEWNSGNDFTPGNGEEEGSTTVNGPASTTLNGLTPASTYFVYYKADCGGGSESIWVGPFTFDTECTTFVAPYTEDFENSGTIPLCWSMDGGEDWEFDLAADVAFDNVGNDGTLTGTTASNGYFAWIDSSGDDGPSTLTSPLIDTSTLTDPTLSFYIISDNQGDPSNDLDVEVWDGAAWNNLGTFNTNTNGWEQRFISLAGLTITGDVQVRFIFSEPIGTFNDDIAIDDVTIDEAPSCFDPTFLTADTITATTANLSWIQDGTVSSWNVEIVTAGTPPTGVATDPGVANPFMASGLTPATNYEYYVQADCGGDLSGWAGPFAFATECTTFVAPYTEDFENSGTIPLCWSMDGGEDWEFDLAADVAFDNVGNDGTLTGTTASNGYFAWIDSSGDDGPSTLTSPLIDTSTLTDPTLSFYIISDNQGDPSNDLDVEVWDGAAWNNVGTFNTNTNGWEQRFISLAGLTITGDVQVRFIFSEPIGTFNDDIAIDDVTIDEAPSCFNPTFLTTADLSFTTADLTWTQDGTAIEWIIEYGEAGFAQGTGTIETGITSIPHQISGLTPDTNYDFYVQAVCSTTESSGFAGPATFFTGYCQSEPTSVDGVGVTNVTIGTTDFPSLGATINYEDQTSPAVDVFAGVDTNLAITFDTGGFDYNTNVWIDFNDDLIFDASELVFQGVSNPPGLNTLDASFVMPITAPPGQHRMRIGTADSGQATPNPCYNGSWGVTLDFTVNVGTLPCVLHEVTFNAVEDCSNNQFFIDVDITDFGDATALEISNNFDTNTQQVTSTGLVQIGPFPSLTSLNVFVANTQESVCTIISPQIQVICPPLNDTPCDATVAVVNDGLLCEQSTSGTIFGATASGEAAPSCGGTADDDVWFQFVAQSEFQLISLANVNGSSVADMDHTVYSGTCDNLTEISCTSGFAEWSSITPQLTIGNTYYIRVYSGGADVEDTVFDLCITDYTAPTAISCDSELASLCSGGNDDNILYYNNILNVPNLGNPDCLGSAPDPTFFELPIGSDGDILIEMVQNTAFDAAGNPIGDELDVDFILWGPIIPGQPFCGDGNIDNITLPVVDCSYSAAPVENVTLTGATAGDLYVLLITNFEQEAGVIQVRQTNLGDPGAGVIQADLEAQITSIDAFINSDNIIQDTCGLTQVTLVADSQGADNYIWFRNGFEITGETTDTLIVTESDIYQVLAIDDGCDAEAFSQIVDVRFYQEPPAVNNEVIEVCDNDENGTASFNLGDITASLGISSDFIVTYYTNTNDANQAVNPVASPYTSSGETLIMRIEDVDAFNNGYLSCRNLADVDLVLRAIPTVIQPEDFIVCDDLDGTVDGVTDFDLTLIDAEIATDEDVTVTYHTSQENADAGTSALPSPYSSSGETIFARVENTVTSCYSTTSFNLAVNVVPLGSIDTEVFYFDDDTGEFLLCAEAETGIILTIIPGTFTLSDATIQWQLDGVDIEGATNLSYQATVAGDYNALITFNSTGCSNLISEDGINVVEVENCTFPQGISPGQLDGLNDTFDLRYFNVTKLEIFNRNGTLVYSKNNYTNEWIGQTNDGEELPVGTYFYVVTYEGGAKQKSAWVYINR